MRDSSQRTLGLEAQFLWGRRRWLSGNWIKEGYWTVAGMKSPERPADMLMKDKIPQGCQACLNLATGEPVIRCLEDGLSVGIYEATFHAAFTQPPLSYVAPSDFMMESEFYLLGPDPRPYLTHSVSLNVINYCVIFFLILL